VKNIIFEKNEGYSLLTINRPAVLNTLNTEVLQELQEVLSSLLALGDGTPLIVTGAGEKSFVAGADIEEMRNKTPGEAREFASLGHTVIRLLEKLPQPVIAAVNGFALGGGCELALACDIRYCSENARFGQPEVSLGITPGFGGSQLLPRIVGKAKAAELLYTGAVIDAREAAQIGLVNLVLPTNEVLMATAINTAQVIAKNSSYAVSLSKNAMNRGLSLELSSGLAIEADCFALCFGHGEQQTRMNAFIAKKKK